MQHGAEEGKGNEGASQRGPSRYHTIGSSLGEWVACEISVPSLSSYIPCLELHTSPMGTRAIMYRARNGKFLAHRNPLWPEIVQ